MFLLRATRVVARAHAVASCLLPTAGIPPISDKFKGWYVGITRLSEKVTHETREGLAEVTRKSSTHEMRICVGVRLLKR